MKDNMKQNLIPTSIKIPAGLKDWLKSQAQANHRTFNGELLHRLERSRQVDQPKEQQQ